MFADVDAVLNAEEQEWVRLTPAQRYVESAKLWAHYLAWGGSLDPEPDSQSPFFFPEARHSISGHGRPGVHPVRRRRVQS